MHNKFELTGNLIKIFDTQEFSKGFKKREFVIEIPHPSYPQEILLNVTQDNCEMLDEFQLNDTITIDFNIRGRSWEAPDGAVKYFTSLEAWRIVLADGSHEYKHTDISGEGEDLSF